METFCAKLNSCEKKRKFQIITLEFLDQDRRADVRAHRAAADLPVAPDRADAAHPVDRALITRTHGRSPSYGGGRR